MNKKCLWCLCSEPVVTFVRKAHTIPKSLGGQNYNPNVCDSCNSYFGNKHGESYSIEEALKETFCISRKMFLNQGSKRKIGNFKSRFFDVKDRNGKPRLSIKPSFKFNLIFQTKLCRSFKRGLYKMYFEELNRQKNQGFEKKYDAIRRFARFNEGDLPVFYFHRHIGIMMLFKWEAETPLLCFDRMNYLYSDAYFTEIEFLGHVFGFPITNFGVDEFRSYLEKSMPLKEKFFKSFVKIEKLTDVDFTLSIMKD